jgi:hypothetical protein
MQGCTAMTSGDVVLGASRGWLVASLVGCGGAAPCIPSGAYGQVGGLLESGESSAWHPAGAHNVDTLGCQHPRWRRCGDAS